MPHYYLTLKQIESWNVTIEAETEEDAVEIAGNLDMEQDPDYTDWDVESHGEVAVRDDD